MIWPFEEKKRLSPKRSDAWPRFTTGNHLVACWTHPDGKHRVFLDAWKDGLFSNLSEVFSDDEYEICWLPEDRGGSLYDSEAEAFSNVLCRVQSIISPGRR